MQRVVLRGRFSHSPSDTSVVLPSPASSSSASFTVTFCFFRYTGRFHLIFSYSPLFLFLHSSVLFLLLPPTGFHLSFPSCLNVTHRHAEAFETFLQIKQDPNFKTLPPLVNEIFSERQCVSPPDTQNAAAPRPVQHPRGGPQKLDAGGSWKGLGNSSWWWWWKGEIGRRRTKQNEGERG